MADLQELSLQRITAQRLAGPPCDSATEAVRWLGAVQAQDLGSACVSVGLRTRAGSPADVQAAMDSGDVVRSWPMRGTLHLVAAGDLRWMLRLGPPRVATVYRRRHEQLGLDDVVLARARTLAEDALAGGRQLRRADLMDCWERAGITTTGQRGYHLLVHLAQTAVVCLGPLVEGEQAFVLLDEWVPRPRRLDRDEALGEWTQRYFTGHGPATLKDFCWWTKLTVGDAKAGLALASPHLESLDVDGVQHWMDPGTPERHAACRAEAGGVYLLPGFDELLLGYTDRSALLDSRYADRIVPGGNGVFQPTVVEDGRVVGTWRRTGRDRATVEAAPFTSFSSVVEAALAERDVSTARTA